MFSASYYMNVNLVCAFFLHWIELKDVRVEQHKIEKKQTKKKEL